MFHTRVARVGGSRCCNIKPPLSLRHVRTSPATCKVRANAHPRKVPFGRPAGTALSGRSVSWHRLAGLRRAFARRCRPRIGFDLERALAERASLTPGPCNLPVQHPGNAEAMGAVSEIVVGRGQRDGNAEGGSIRSGGSAAFSNDVYCRLALYQIHSFFVVLYTSVFSLPFFARPRSDRLFLLY